MSEPGEEHERTVDFDVLGSTSEPRRPAEPESDPVQRLQRELATRDRHIAELQAQLRAQARSIFELRTQLHAGRDLLEQRNGLILRLEAEVASSVAMLSGAASDEPNSEPPPVRVATESRWVLQAEGGAAHLLERRTTVGRTPDNDFSRDADSISRHHAVILRSGVRYVIEDLNSTNGTFVNGVRVNRRVLEVGDRLMLGRVEFRFLPQPSEP